MDTDHNRLVLVSHLLWVLSRYVALCNISTSTAVDDRGTAYFVINCSTSVNLNLPDSKIEFLVFCRNLIIQYYAITWCMTLLISRSLMYVETYQYCEMYG